MTPTTKARIDEIQSKLGDSEETYPVQFRNVRHPLPVILISLDNVLLNARSHRIRAQIESHPWREKLASDPYSVESQQFIEEILRETPGFGALLNDLEEKGQIDTGIITHLGVLVNANTRAVALRQLRRPYIRVGVLPPSATEREITELEAHLQLSRDLRQDYSLTNELLFIQEQIDQGMAKEDLAILLGKAQSRKGAQLKKGVEEIEKSLRILQHIREVQNEGGGQPPLTFFDAHESALAEADAAYVQARSRSNEEATRVRDGRMLGILTGVTYRNLRNWDSDEFLTNYLKPQFEDVDVFPELPLTTMTSSDEEIDDGLSIFDGVVDEEENPGFVNVGALLALVAKVHGEPPEAQVMAELTKEQLVESIAERITQAAEEKSSDQRDEKRAMTPVLLIRDARRKVARATESLDSARAERDFEPGKLKLELRRLKRELELIIGKFETGG